VNKVSPEKPQFLSGVVEGFYGKPWSWALRRRYAHYLSELGLNTYLYCPKSDGYLRRNWSQPWPTEIFRQLGDVANSCRQAGINFGVGLSPYALYQHYGNKQQDCLRAKLTELSRLQPAILAVLFDDMPGDHQQLADIQGRIITDIRRWCDIPRIIMCPTYYSFDPVLERHFGDRPKRYWSCLGAALPEGVDILWTGNRVCSESIYADDIRGISEALGRPVLLWDNYPVNDGAERSKHLYLQPLSRRGPFEAGQVSGHLCNPMNQGCVSMLPLLGLGALYGTLSPSNIERQAEQLFGKPTAAALLRDRALFQQIGLGSMGESQCQQLASEYAAFDTAAGAEVASWLRGEYQFDPTCLTD